MRSVFAAADRIRWVLLAMVLGTFLVIIVPRAQAKAFWHDEIYTILEADLSPSTLYRADLDALDFAPPLAPMVTKIPIAVFGLGRLTTRSPEIAAFLVSVIFIFVIVRRRSNTVVAVVASLLPFFTPLVDYAFEARGYALTCGLYAVALYAWLEAAAGRRRQLHLAVMAAALCLGVWAHYFAILAFLPIGVGEGVRQWRAGRLDKGPWIAMLAAGAGILGLVPIMIAASRQRGHFWTQDVMTVGQAYGWIAGRLTSDRSVLAAEIAVALIVFEGARRLAGRSNTRRLAPHEAAAGLVALMLPVFGVLLGTLTGVATMRYVLLSGVGIAIALPLAIWRLTPDNGLAELLMCAALLTSVVKSTGRSLQHSQERTEAQIARPLLEQSLRGSDPLVMTGAGRYLERWFATPPEWRARVIYLANPAAELQSDGNDTFDRSYLALARWTPVAVVDEEIFLATHTQFSVYSMAPDWLMPTLDARGATIETVGRESGATLFTVRMPVRASDASR